MDFLFTSLTLFSFSTPILSTLFRFSSKIMRTILKFFKTVHLSDDRGRNIYIFFNFALWHFWIEHSFFFFFFRGVEVEKGMLMNKNWRLNDEGGRGERRWNIQKKKKTWIVIFNDLNCCSSTDDGLKNSHFVKAFFFFDCPFYMCLFCSLFASCTSISFCFNCFWNRIDNNKEITDNGEHIF